MRLKNLDENKLKDIIYVCLLAAVSFIMIYVCGGKYEVFGSRVDWIKQHFTFAEYFRMQFYETGELFPEFAKNIGAGQNIYNFSYYGFLSPVIMLSYLFPWVSMTDYIMAMSVISIVASVILLYLWLRGNVDNRFVCFLVAVIFLCSAPLIFHSHRHIMFVNYFPFLILALWGVDRYIAKKSPLLMILSMFLMIMTSYFYSVSGLCAVSLYWLYRFMESREPKNLKSVSTAIFKYSLCVICAVLMACILILPTLNALLSGRGEADTGNGGMNLKELIIPKFDMAKQMYDSYGMGLTFVTILAIIHMLTTRKKGNIFMAVVLIIIIYCPISLYILNGTLYIRPKVLIPFIPVIMWILAKFFHDVIEEEIKYKVLFLIGVVFSAVLLYYSGNQMREYYILDVVLIVSGLALMYFTKNKYIACAIMGSMAIVVCITSNASENFVTYDELNAVNSKDKQELVYNVIENDSGYHRFQDLSTQTTCNKIYHSKYFMTSIYSSSYSKSYKEFHMNLFNNANSSKNNITCENSNNILFETLMGVKYIITNSHDAVPYGYKYLSSSGKYSIYCNSNVFSIGYANSNIMSYETFETLNENEKKLALLDCIITDGGDTSYVQGAKEYSLSLPFERDEQGRYIVDLAADLMIDIPIDFDIYENVVLANIKLSEVPKDTPVTISINGIKNVLSSKKSPYPNNNLNFGYVISSDSEQRVLKFMFSAGKYVIESFDINYIPSIQLYKFRKNIDTLNLDDTKKNNVYEGNINVRNDGYFMMTVPYDKGFRAYVDGKETEVENVDTTFIGFPIDAGEHHIKIVYRAPLAALGKMLTLAGIVMLFIIQLYYLQKHKSNV